MYICIHVCINAGSFVFERLGNSCEETVMFCYVAGSNFAIEDKYSALCNRWVNS